MNALMDVLSKNPKSASASEESGEGEDASGDLMDPNFEAGASQVMEAVKSGDSAAFADALKACIEMAR